MVYFIQVISYKHRFLNPLNPESPGVSKLDTHIVDPSQFTIQLCYGKFYGLHGNSSMVTKENNIVYVYFIICHQFRHFIDIFNI